jgi:transglutaminase-like putative cysteine protease
MKTGFVKCRKVLVGLILGGMSFSAVASEGNFFPVSLQKSISTYTVKKDGSFNELRETSTLIETEEGASRFGERKISFIPKLESVEILDAYTILPNGTHIKVPLKNIRSSKGDMDSVQATYSDNQYRVVIYPNVIVGSQLYLKYIQTRHTPLFAGQFDLRRMVSPYIKEAHFEININFDPRIDIKLYSKGIEGAMLPDKNGMHRYRFTYKQDKIIPIGASDVSPDDYAPYVQATTFASYEALGAAYQDKAKQKVKVTPSIQKLANDLTRGVDDKREQTRILYNWVSKNIRYVGSYIGNGGYVPHDSQTILDNKWGDCKDHVVMLESLLAARGIDSSPALINTGATYVLPKLATLVFDHVITYVPSLDLYLDSTARFVPFGTLPVSDLDKSVVLTGLNKLGKTPPMTAQENVAKTYMRLKIMPDGTIQGSSQTAVLGSMDFSLRNEQFSNQDLPQVEIVNRKLSEVNLTGVGEIHSSNPSDLDTPFELNAVFTLDPVSNFPGPAAMPIPAGLAFEVITGNMYSKPKDKVNFPEDCHSFTYSNHYEIEFPTNIKITHVPDNVKYSDKGTQYNATYTLKANRLEVNREFVSAHQSMVCDDADNELDKKFFPIFQRDMRAQVIYE